MRRYAWWGLLAGLTTGACGLSPGAISSGALFDGAAGVEVDGAGREQADAAVPASEDAARAAPPAATDAGGDGGSAGTDAGDPRPLVRTATVAPIPAGTVKLLGDPAAVFGVTADGMLWALDQGTTSVRQLVAGGSPGRGIAVTIAGSNLFWTDAAAGTLHRTARDGGLDAVLASGLRAPTQATADDTRVYWLTGGDPLYGEGGGQIESLPLDAMPGDPPQVLVTIGQLSAVSSMAATGGALYWTPYSAGATMYYASLVTASVSTLLSGGTGTALPGIAEPYGLAAIGNDVYLGYLRTRWTTVITRLSDQMLLSVLPINVSVTGLAITGDWLLVTGAGENQHQDLYVTPLQSPSGFVVAATDLECPAVVTPWGVTYVNTAGALVAFPAAQLGYVGFGLAPP